MTIRCRTEMPADEPFVRALVTDHVTAELGAGAWPEPMRGHLAGIQYHARLADARNRYQTTTNLIVLRDEQPAGWMVTAATEVETWLVEIIIGEPHRGQGVGTTVLRELLAESDRTGKPLRLYVRLKNPARRLYERLGFRRAGGNELQDELEYRGVCT